MIYYNDNNELCYRGSIEGYNKFKESLLAAATPQSTARNISKPSTRKSNYTPPKKKRKK